LLRNRLRDAQRDPLAPPFDEIRTYAVEAYAMPEQVDLSPLPSDDEEEGLEDQEVQLGQWGPKFRRLADIYSRDV